MDADLVRESPPRAVEQEGAKAPFDAAALASCVATDLEPIFAAFPQPTVKDQGGVARLRRGAVELETVRRRVPLSTLGAVVAAGLLGLGAGSLLGKPKHEAVSQPQAVVPPPATDLAALTPPADPPASAPLTYQKPTKAVRPIERVKHSGRARSSANRIASTSGRCGNTTACLRAEMADADRRLRGAYGNAVRAGMSRSVLEDYRDDWNDLRKLASSNPRRMVGEYRNLARDLERRTATRRSDEADDRYGPDDE